MFLLFSRNCVVVLVIGVRTGVGGLGRRGKVMGRGEEMGWRQGEGGREAGVRI